MRAPINLLSNVKSVNVARITPSQEVKSLLIVRSLDSEAYFGEKQSLLSTALASEQIRRTSLQVRLRELPEHENLEHGTMANATFLDVQ